MANFFPIQKSNCDTNVVSIIFRSTGFNLFVGNHLIIFCMGILLNILFYFTNLHFTLFQYHSLLITVAL